MAIDELLQHVYIAGSIQGVADFNPSGAGGATENGVYVLELNSVNGVFDAASFEDLDDTRALGITTGGSNLWEVALAVDDGDGDASYRWYPSGPPIVEGNVGLAGVAYTNFTGFPTSIYAGYTATATPFGFTVTEPSNRNCMIVGFDEADEPRWLLDGVSLLGGSCQLRAANTKGHILQVVGEVSSQGASFSGTLVPGCTTFQYVLEPHCGRCRGLFMSVGLVRLNSN